MRLTDWIIERVEVQQMQQITPISIPADLTFAALRLARDADGMVSFDTSVISRIEAASGLSDGFFMGQHEGAIAELLTYWYRLHIAAGGNPDPVQEDLIAESRAEDERGGGYSHQPGSA